VALVLIWLASRTLLLRTELKPRERLANAIDFLREATLRPLNDEERSQAVRLVEESGADDPIAPQIRRMLEDLETVPAAEFPGGTLVARARTFYEVLVTKPSVQVARDCRVRPAHAGCPAFRREPDRRGRPPRALRVH
jgi:hypothetical protein